MLLVDTIKKTNKTKIPFWFMRQAGRYLPEYIKIRDNCKQSGIDFMQMCYNVDIATEITLQPIKRFGMHGAIVFSDILVVPDAMGFNVQFQENIGPIIEGFNLDKRIKNINIEKFKIVGDVIKNVRQNLDKDKAVIGFSGSPLTLACYIINGKSSADFALVKKFIYENEHIFLDLIETLTDVIVQYLEIQIESGADIVQLFDSHAGILTGEMYEKYVIHSNRNVVERIKEKFPNIPVICFPKGSGMLYQLFAQNVECDVISVDNSASCGFFKSAIESQIIQGNLDNFLLSYGIKGEILLNIENIIRNFKDSNKSFIFNLSHGILKDANLDNISMLVDFLHDYNSKV